jgi:hypothetical protein
MVLLLVGQCHVLLRVVAAHRRTHKGASTASYEAELCPTMKGLEWGTTKML